MSGRPPIDITGQRFGRLVAIDPHSTRPDGIFWNCLCDCGKKIVVRGVNLRIKRTRSCGCLQAELTEIRTSLRRTKKRIENRKMFGFAVTASVDDALDELLK